MQTLLRSLQDHDLGHLRILAELWGLDPPAGPPVLAAQALAEAILDSAGLQETLGSLEPAAKRSFEALLIRGGRAPLADFERRYGQLREMGPGRRDREKPWRSPSPVEALWYRGLIARAFADTTTGPQEFIFIPSDLLERLQPQVHASPAPPGRPAATPLATRLGDWTAADDATTMFAALRRRTTRTPPRAGWEESLAPFLRRPVAVPMLLALARGERIIDASSLRPQAQPVRSFLDLPRPEASLRLMLAWESSTSWNDLAHTPQLANGTDVWPNDPAASRRAALAHLVTIPEGVWWDLQTWIEDIHIQDPGFQRPGGDFDAWYLQDVETGTFLRGFDHWHEVEGAYLRFLITGPLHWLGALDLGLGSRGDSVTCFRKTSLAASLSDTALVPPIPEDEPALAAVYPDGRIEIPATASRSLRYQIARICDWEPATPPVFAYRLSPSSLQAAVAQGLGAAQVISLLESASRRRLPNGLRQAIERAIAHGTPARLERQLILRVDQAAVLDGLRRQRTTARYLGESLGPTTVLVRERDWPALCAAAARVGILIEPPRDTPTASS
jgi:Helicase conserved C-terminal domain